MECSSKVSKKDKCFHDLEASLNAVLAEANEKADQEYLKVQLSAIQDMRKSWKHSQSDTNISESDYFAAEEETSDSSECSSPKTAKFRQTGLEEETSDSSECSSPKTAKSRKTGLFEINRPEQGEVEGLIGLHDAKVFLLAAIKGPIDFPQHQSRMRSNSRLKAYIFYGPPGE